MQPLSSMPLPALPLVCVIIPTYNSSATIGATLDSLIQQTAPRWEAVVVDDGSDDNTRDIIGAYVAKDARIRLVTAHHGGPACARNIALNHARATWVVFLDSDDELSSSHLELMLQHAAEHESADVLHGGWRRYSSTGLLLSEIPADLCGSPVEVTALRCPFVIHAAMTRRDALRAVEGFDASLGVCEDWDLWQRLARAGFWFQAVPHITVDVRIRPGSFSSNSLRLLEAGLARIDQAFEPDPRLASVAQVKQVPPSPALRENGRTHYILWNLGRAVSLGEDLEQHFAVAGSLNVLGSDLQDTAMTLIDGLLVGAQCQVTDWPIVWPSIAKGLAAVMVWLDRLDVQALAGGRLLFVIEQKIGYLLADEPELIVGRLRVTTIDISGEIGDVVTASTISRLRVHLVARGERIGTFETLTTGVLPAAKLGRLIHGTLSYDLIAWAAPQRDAVAKFSPVLTRLTARLLGRHRLDDRFAPLAVLATRTPDSFAHSIASKMAKPADRAGSDKDSGPWTPPDYSSPQYWESVFDREDPWEYRNDYETLKYEQTLTLVPQPKPKRALEVACAEGLFSRMLAPHVDSLLATDISAGALSRAALNCSEHANIEFARLDILRDRLPGQHDLIVCSEVLYYLSSDDLARFAANVREALTDEGCLILAHANLLVDEPDKTGFPWPHAHGAKGIGQCFIKQGLHLEQEIWTPLYRIQKMRCNQVFGNAVLTQMSTAKRLPARVASQVCWGGSIAEPQAEGWSSFPVLMYHSVADEGPEGLKRYRIGTRQFEEQMTLLHAAGWRAISCARLARALYDHQPVPAKSFVLTFDDGYLDFVENALPVLHKFDFPSTLFVPATKVGQSASWDTSHGEPAALLDWDDLQAVSHSNVTIGSHGCSHLSLPALGALRQVEELIESRSLLAGPTGQRIDAIAYPYGDYSDALTDAAARSDYKLGMTCDHGWVSEGADPLKLPRIEIRGDLDATAFRQLLGI